MALPFQIQAQRRRRRGRSRRGVAPLDAAARCCQSPAHARAGMDEEHHVSARGAAHPLEGAKLRGAERLARRAELAQLLLEDHLARRRRVDPGALQRAQRQPLGFEGPLELGENVLETRGGHRSTSLPDDVDHALRDGPGVDLELAVLDLVPQAFDLGGVDLATRRERPCLRRDRDVRRLARDRARLGLRPLGGPAPVHLRGRAYTRRAYVGIDGLVVYLHALASFNMLAKLRYGTRKSSPSARNGRIRDTFSRVGGYGGRLGIA